METGTLRISFAVKGKFIADIETGKLCELVTDAYTFDVPKDFDMERATNTVAECIEAIVKVFGVTEVMVYCADADNPGCFTFKYIPDVDFIKSFSIGKMDPEILINLDRLSKEVFSFYQSAIMLAKSKGAVASPKTTGSLAETAKEIKESETSEEALDELIKVICEKAKVTISKPKETLEDYICEGNLERELLSIKDFFENFDKYNSVGIHIPKGVLLKGLPGTGKTFAARCIAGSTDCLFMSCTASAMQGMYIGSGAQNIRDVFQGARQLIEKSGKGVILFIDELDSFGSRERHNGGAGTEEDRTLNQLLAEMSGFEDTDKIMILGASNYPERIDSALMRSGRFSRQITITPPTDNCRFNMLKHYFGKLKVGLDFDIEDIVPATKNFTAADISELTNEAGIMAVQECPTGTEVCTITQTILDEAINKIITKDIKNEDKELDAKLNLVTVHEAGHVLTEWCCCESVPIKVTNYSYGSAGGFTQPNISLEGIVKKEAYKNYVLTLLGGRAAEEETFEEVSTGASNDLEKAKSLIRNYFEVYNFEEYVPSELDNKVIETLNAWYTEICDIVHTNKKFLIKVADKLYSARTLYTKDLNEIIKECYE